MIKINEQLLEYAAKYENAFDVQLPLRMLPQSLTNEELYKIIDDCISNGRNDLDKFYNEGLDSNILL